MAFRPAHRLLAGLGVLSLLVLTGQSCVLQGGQAADGGVYRSDDGGRTWARSNFVGQVKKKTVTIASVDTGRLAFHPTNHSKIYLGTRGNGLYRTDDGGERWQITGKTSGAITALAIDPVTPEIIYTGNGGHIEKTSDSGQTWERVYIETRTNISITSIVIDRSQPSHLLAGNTGGVILESDDYGTTWNIITSLMGSVIIYSHPTDASVYFATGDQFGLARSTDRGQTWSMLTEELKSFPGASKIYDLAVAASLPSRVFLATDNGLLTSSDVGSTWAQVKTLIPNRTLPIKTTAVSPSSESYIYFTAQNKLHFSRDAGQTWEVASLPTSRDIIDLVINPSNPNQIFIGVVTVKK